MRHIGITSTEVTVYTTKGLNMHQFNKLETLFPILWLRDMNGTRLTVEISKVDLFQLRFKIFF